MKWVIVEIPRFSWICSLRIALRDIDAVAACGGLKVIFQTLLEGSKFLVDIVVPTIISLLDQPWTRQYFKPGINVEVRYLC